MDSLPGSQADATRRNLQTIVSELCSEANLDSSGYFTVDSRKALEKMRRFQVQQPQEYVLWLAAAAIQCKATSLIVTRGIDRICVEFDDHALEPKALQRLLEEGIQHRPGPIGHLAFALTAALCAQPEEILIESGDQRFHMKEGYTRLSPIAEPSAPRVRFILIHLNKPDLQWDYPESGLLHRRVPGQFLSMEVNQKRCSGYHLGPDLLHGLHFWQGTHPGNPLQPLLTSSPHTHHTHDAPYSLLLALDTWRRNAQGEVSFLYEGLLFPVQVPAEFDFRAIVYAPELRLDLSRSQIVQSQLYEEILQTVASLSVGLAEQFLDRYPNLRPGHRELAQPWLKTLQARWIRLGDSKRAGACERWLALHHRPGAWVDQNDPSKLVNQLVTQMPEPSLERSLPSGPPSFWGWLASLMPGSTRSWPAVADDSLQSLREAMAVKKRWRDLLSALLHLFDAESSFRVGIALDSPNPTWLVLEGVTADGAHLVVSAESAQVMVNHQVMIHVHLPPGWTTPPALPTDLSVPADWEVLKNSPPFRFRSSARSWQEPSELLALVKCVLEAHRQSQIRESLPCPGCAGAMEKLLLDLVLDRCLSCRAMWLDYAEFDWLRKKNPHLKWLPPPDGGQCPRCRVALQPGQHQPGARCPQCQGVWLATES
jgi:Zn-finger nucleic acid-binding protein